MNTLRNAALSCFLLAFAAGALAADTSSKVRRKVDVDHYVGFTGHLWKDDYGIRAGRCNREAIGAMLGAPVRRAALARGDDPEVRTTAILIGSASGALIGAKTGRALDEYDRACIGHILELADNGRPVQWLAQGVTYTVIAGKARGNGCRSYTLKGEGQGSGDSTRAAACRRDDGAWVPRG